MSETKTPSRTTELFMMVEKIYRLTDGEGVYIQASFLRELKEEFRLISLELAQSNEAREALAQKYHAASQSLIKTERKLDIALNEIGRQQLFMLESKNRYEAEISELTNNRISYEPTVVEKKVVHER